MFARVLKHYLSEFWSLVIYSLNIFVSTLTVTWWPFNFATNLYHYLLLSSLHFMSLDIIELHHSNLFTLNHTHFSNFSLPPWWAWIMPQITLICLTSPCIFLGSISFCLFYFSLTLTLIEPKILSVPLQNSSNLVVIVEH